jgi:acyl-CoA synthetase (AMP-forming)/AMP-acid ligase II
LPVEEAEAMTGSGAIGKPYADVEHRLVDDEGEEVAIGEPGELKVRVRDIMSGYLNRPDATAAAIDPEGWFSTGDLMRRDDAGWFYFVGRKKDIIRRAGENIAAGEVEEVLRGHPRVIDVAVVPVADPLRGEEAFAHIYAESDESWEAMAQEIAELCEQKLAPYKVPRYMRVQTDDLPRTASMRVAKPQLAKLGITDDALDREIGR